METLLQGSVVSDTFKNLGYDGIVLVNAKERFDNMEMEDGTSHVHIFNDQKGKIKLADGTNVTFDGSTNDIRFRASNEGQHDTAFGKSIKESKAARIAKKFSVPISTKVVSRV